MYIKVCEKIITFVWLYVEDMLIISNDIEWIKEMKMFLSFMFIIKDLGQVNSIFGIKVKKGSGDYSLNHYIMLRMW